VSVRRKIAYAFAVFLFVFGLLEYLLATSWKPVLDKQTLAVGMQLRPDPDLIWSLEPGEAIQFGVKIAVDPNGMRKGAIDDGDRRWLIVGDSSFFGHGLAHEDTLHSALKTELSQVGHRIDVHVGAVPGHSILQSTRWLDRQGWELEPDVLIVGNLWSDNHFAQFQDHVWLNTLDSTSSRAQFWLGRLRSFQWLAQTMRPLNIEEGVDVNRRISWVREPYEGGPRRRVPLNRYASALDELLADAEERGVGVVMVQPANRYRLRGDVPNPTWAPYFKAQREVAERRHVLIVDMVDAMSAAGLSAEEAFIDDMHPSASGVDSMARHVVSAVLEAGWPDRHLIPKTNHPFRPVMTDPWEGGPPGKLGSH